MIKKSLGILALAILAVSCSAPVGKDLSLGLGHSSIFRVGPGKDSTGTQVYSFTYVYATVLFDKSGKIVDLETDELEVSTPNYDGASMPHFAGWPGNPAPNFTNHDTEKVDGTFANTDEAVAQQVAEWKTKRDRGDSYGMNTKNDWWKQMDNWEKQFLGKSVDEVDAFYKKYTNDKNGRPLNPASTDAAEKAKFSNMTASDKQTVADVRSGATMSINDAHGYVLAAIRDAWNKKKPVGQTK